MKTFRKPYRIKKKRSIFRNRFFWLGILIIIFLFSIFYFLFFSEFFQLEKVIISGNEKVPVEDIRKLIESTIKKKILVFQTKSIFLTSKNQIQEIVFRNFPQIAKVDFKKQLPQTLVIKIEERKPVAIVSSEKNDFLIDEEGIIFEEILGDNLQLIKIKGPNLEKEIKLGEKVVEKELLSQILEVKSQIENALKIPIVDEAGASSSPFANTNTRVTEVLIVSEERLNFKTFEGWEIYFNPQKDSNWQLTKLKVDLENLIPFERRKNLEYIELRFGDSAPFKYR